MPKKIREIIAALIAAGFREQAGAGKGSHRKFVHERYAGIVTVSGNAGDDAKRDANLKAMIDSCVRFIDFDRIDVTPTSEYNLSR